MLRIDIILCIGLLSMALVTLAIAKIAVAYFEAVGRNPQIATSVTGPLLALAGMVELAILIITAVVLFLMFKV
jgi:F0F1-type ATP synthase membrane subunit c/vacuolar-type H+-ATPase subunit K